MSGLRRADKPMSEAEIRGLLARNLLPARESRWPAVDRTKSPAARP